MPLTIEKAIERVRTVIVKGLTPYAGVVDADKSDDSDAEILIEIDNGEGDGETIIAVLKIELA